MIRHSLFALGALVLCYGVAQAQEYGGMPCNEACQIWMQGTPQPEQNDSAAATVRVSADHASMVNDYYSLNPDCSSRGEVAISVNQPAVHGVVTIDRARMHPRFERGNPMSVCNARKVEVTRMFFEPEPGFRSDSFEVSVIFPNGETSVERYAVVARR